MNDGATALPSDQLLDALEVAVFVFDRKGEITFANRRARREGATQHRALTLTAGKFAQSSAAQIGRDAI